MATPEKYAHIDFKPPQGARDEAEKSLTWRREFGRGGTAVGIARARDLSNGVEVSPSTVRRMKAFFDRHQKNKSAPGWSPDEDGFPSNSRIAWAMWGSDAGWSWAKKVVEQMNAADEKDKSERGLRPYGSTHGMRPKVYVVHGAPCSGKKDYVASHLGENDVVFDYDEVMAAISGRPIYQPNSNLVSYCLDIRTLILKKALKSQDIGKTWVIATRVGDDMKSMLSDVPTQYVHVDKPKEECLQRLEQDERRQPIAEELRKVIEEYFSSENEEHRRAPLAQPGVERRFLGNFSSAERLDPELLRVEKRSDPETGRPQTYIVGYAARFHRDSLLLGDFVEQIDPGAFEIVTNRRDEDGKPLETRCLFNHDPNYLLGRFPTTMRMVVDDKGLKYECLLPEAHSGIAESIARGDLKGSSFSFVVAEGGERWATENGQSRRIVTKVKAILDCGPVTYPAYSDASVAVAKRSYEGFVGEAKKPVVEKRLDSLAKRAEVLRTRIAAEAFLAERRDCGRGEGGKFGSGNECQAKGKGGSANIAKAKKAQHDYESKRKGGGIKEDKKFSSPDGKGGGLSGAIAGAVVGATVGAAGGGLVGLAVGSLTGAAFGAVAGMRGASVNKAKYEGLKKKTGISESQVKKAAGIIAGESAKSASFAADGDTLMIESNDKNETLTFITAKSQFSKSEGTSVHVTASYLEEPTNIRRVESAAKTLGASNVSVEAWSDEDAKSLKKSGYTMVAATGEGSSSSKGVWEKKLKGELAPKVVAKKLSGSKNPNVALAKKAMEDWEAKRKSRRSASPVSCRDCGRGEGGQFGSGNKCQDDSEGAEPQKSGKPSPKGEKGAAQKAPPPKDDSPKYMELSKPVTPTKAKAAQKFIDTARKGQLERGGKDKGKSDDGSGVQTWSKGDSYPWTTKQVGDSKKGGYVQGTHPDGSMTEKYKFPAGSDGAEAYKQAEDEIKKKTIRSLRAFLEARR